MVNLPKKFNIGDKVFAKVRGYPPWPAKVERVVDPNTKNAKYSVYFYGTGETALCKVEELFDYLENKAKYGKTMRRKFFNEGIQQLEQELGIFQPTSIPIKSKETTKVSTAQENLSYKSDDGANESITTTSSDTESKLVIDEGEPKKGLKRKSVLPSSQNNTPEVKKRRVGRPPLSESKKQQQQQYNLQQQQQQQQQPEITKQLESSRDTETESQDEDNTGKKFISRSGRKIKPKPFFDFEDTPEMQKNEHSGRTKLKHKFEENENQNSISSPLQKQKASPEKVNNLNLTPIKSESESTNNYVLTRTFSGEIVGIKLKMETIDSDKLHDQWDWTQVRKVLKLKSKLENGEILPEQVKSELEFNVNLSEEEKAFLDKHNTFYNKCRDKWVQVQNQLLISDELIRSSLSQEKANLDKGLEAMDSFLYLPIDAVMLKNNPIVVETVKKLRCYVGNLAAWNLSEEETAIFKEKAEQIRQKADNIFNRFCGMFTIPEKQSFWVTFADEIERYEKLIAEKNISDEDKYLLFIDSAESDEQSKCENDERSDKDKTNLNADELATKDISSEHELET